MVRGGTGGGRCRDFSQHEAHGGRSPGRRGYRRIQGGQYTSGSSRPQRRAGQSRAHRSKQLRCGWISPSCDPPFDLWLFGQATRKEVAVEGEPAVTLPGICSNPEPTDLSDMPLDSSDYTRYLLAEAEIAFGSPVGIETGLRAHLGDRAIPSMELLLRGTRVEYSMRRFDAKGLIANLPTWIDAGVYLDKHREVVQQSNPHNPTYGEIDPATPEQLRGERAIAIAMDLLLAFGILAAVKQQPAPLGALCDLSAEI